MLILLSSALFNTAERLTRLPFDVNDEISTINFSFSVNTCLFSIEYASIKLTANIIINKSNFFIFIITPFFIYNKTVRSFFKI